MTTANLDSTDLLGVDYGGLITESVMASIWDISAIPLPVSDLIGSDTTGNEYTSWVTDRLADPALGGWVVDGADSDKNDANTGKRIGNHAGILTKEVRVSTRARASDTIGHSDELAYQIMMRQRELRRDVEANILGTQGSTESDANSDVAGVPASLFVMMEKFNTGSGGSGGEFSSGLWSDWTAGGTPVALSETMVRDACQAAWQDGADPSVFMSTPSLIRALSEYMFTSSSRIATLTGETRNQGPATAMGSVNVFLTDFGVTLDLVANRIQRGYDVAGTADGCAAAVMDPAYARLTYLDGYRVDELAKTGLSDKREMAVDFTCKVLEPKAHRAMMDLDPSAPVTQA